MPLMMIIITMTMMMLMVVVVSSSMFLAPSDPQVAYFPSGEWPTF